METRSVRIPLSIKIVIGCYVVGLVIRALTAATFLRAKEPTSTWYIISGVEIVLILYQLLALPRLSRWAPIIQAVIVIGFTANRYVQDPNWTQRYPMLGVFAIITPTLVYMAMVLPHWRKMNWAPFGLPYRARAELDIAVF